MHLRPNRTIFQPVLGLMMLVLFCGCGPTVSRFHLLQNRSRVDVSGLTQVQSVENVNASIALPDGWEKDEPIHHGPLLDQRWISGSHDTAVGVGYLRTPWPLSASTLVWFAKREFTKKENAGWIASEWTDALGRPWYEAENPEFHIIGYAFTDGFDAWFIYYAYKAYRPFHDDEVNLAARSLETVIPQTDDSTGQAENIHRGDAETAE
jgi:hypothetical protein